MSRETGNEFRCCDVINRVELTSPFSESSVIIEKVFQKCLQTTNLCHLDDFSSTDSSSGSSESGEFEVVSIVRPYANEPLAHSSDESEEDETDQGGLYPAILRGRFQDEVSVNDWLEITICGTRYS